jgi:hypothetical protein
MLKTLAVDAGVGMDVEAAPGLGGSTDWQRIGER